MTNDEHQQTDQQPDTEESAAPLEIDLDNDNDNGMLDLETLGTSPYSPILTIGACAFRLDNDVPIRDVFYCAVTLESCLNLGMIPEAKTIRWWTTDPDIDPAAREAAFNDPNAVTINSALVQFSNWIEEHKDINLWGNGAKFDLGLLEAAYKVCKLHIPWHFRGESCYRTIKKLPMARTIKLERVGTLHNALDDALSQAYHLRAINRQMGLNL